jgi:hypothetical protein
MGLASGVIREQNASAYNSDSTCGHTPENATCQGRVDAVSLHDKLLIAGFAAGGAMAVSGAVLLIVNRSRPRSDLARSTPWLPRCNASTDGLTRWGLQCQLRF